MKTKLSFIILFISVFLLCNPIKTFAYNDNSKTEEINFNLDFTTSIPNKKEYTNFCIIWVGDSRTVGMDNSTKKIQNSNEYFVAETGKGYSWLKETGINEIDNIINSTEYKKYKIVFLLGVNDLENYSKYLEYYTYLKNEKYSDYELYFCTVNPVVDGKSNATTEKVNKFNEELNKLININTYDFIIDTFNAPDGLHYNKETYINIYKYIKKHIKKTQMYYT